MAPKHPDHRPQPAKHCANPEPRRPDIQHSRSRVERNDASHNEGDFVRDDELILEPYGDAEANLPPPLPKDTWRPPRAPGAREDRGTRPSLEDTEAASYRPQESSRMASPRHAWHKRVVSGDGLPGAERAARAVPPSTRVTALTDRTRHSREVPSDDQFSDGERDSWTSETVTQSRRPVREVIRDGDVLLGKYRVRRVATHGLVTTAEVVHLELGNRAHVQLLLERSSTFAQVQDHFIRSARSLMKMHSRHMARVLDAGTLDSGVPYLVTQWVGSMDLGRYLREQGTLPIHVAIDHVLQICEALAEAHSLGVIHGSIQPSNVRLSVGFDGWQTVTLYGFGVLGQWMLSSETGASGFSNDLHVLRAVQYLSPEQIRQPEEIDELTDIWSVGALLHELLVSAPPFQEPNVTALLAKIVADPAPNLADLRDGIPRELESIVARCLSKDRAARFPSIAELARCLQPFATEESTALVERIVRVAARRAAATQTVRSNSQALVHVPRRQPRGLPKDGWSMANPSAELPSAMQTPRISMRWYLGAATCAVIAVGSLAGVVGAYVTARVVRDGTPATAHPAHAEPLVRSFAATPKPTPTSETLIAEAASSVRPASAPPPRALRRAKPLAAPAPVEEPKAHESEAATDSSDVSRLLSSKPSSKQASHRPATLENQLFDDIK